MPICYKKPESLPTRNEAPNLYAMLVELYPDHQEHRLVAKYLPRDEGEDYQCSCGATLSLTSKQLATGLAVPAAPEMDR
jgi:hypothetical protein